MKNKSVKVFANTKCPERCVVRLYEKYMALRPEGAPSDVFYLRPLDKPRPGCWYTRKPVGHNPLSQTVKKLLENVGVQGYYTNHSLRRTCATRLYQHGADEQQIMAVTGHRSKDGVRNYKEPSLDQERQLNEMLQMPQKRARIDEGLLQQKDNIKTPMPTYHFDNCNVTLKFWAIAVNKC